MVKQSKWKVVSLMQDSILTDVKKLLGITEDYTHFDTDIVIYINSALSTLNQIGVGPQEGYRIGSADEGWSEFMGNTDLLEEIKSYVYLKVRLIFDPPTNAFMVTAMEKQIDELTWRLSVKGGEI